jgi:RNA polymerase sigma-70 factor (ECF subfamily)
MVQRASGSPSAPAGRALADLCERYWLPLYGFARRRCGSADEAQDLTQGFFVELLERELLKRADPTRGRFRTFLLAAFQNFISHDWQRRRAQKRGGGRLPLSLDFTWAESRLSLEPAENQTPEREFERLWALQLLDASFDAVKRDYAARDQEQLFANLKPFMLGEQGDVSLAQVAVKLGINTAAAKVALHRLRSRYRDALRAEICATLTDPSDADDEIRRLFTAFA